MAPQPGNTTPHQQTQDPYFRAILGMSQQDHGKPFFHDQYWFSQSKIDAYLATNRLARISTYNHAIGLDSVLARNISLPLLTKNFIKIL